MPVDVFEWNLAIKPFATLSFWRNRMASFICCMYRPVREHEFAPLAADVRRFEEHLQHEAETRPQTMV